MKRRTLWSTLLGTGLVVLPAACGGQDAGPSPDSVKITTLDIQPSDPQALKDAKTKFATLCQTCHGTSGHGDGPAGQTLDPKPRSFADQDWQKSVTDNHIRKIIVNGGAAVGKSPQMPPNPDLATKPEVVTYLMKIVRWFGER